MIYFIDFDGTIVDCWERYFKIFSQGNDIFDLDFDKYVYLKRKYIKDMDVAKALDFNIKEGYFQYKHQCLEDESFLNLDKMLIDIDVLEEFFKNNEAYVLTKRRKKEHFINQIKSLGLNFMIDKNIVLDDSINLSKKEWLYFNEYLGCTLVGDGTEEISTCFDEKINTVIVDTGFTTISSIANKAMVNTILVSSLQNFIERLDDL